MSTFHFCWLSRPQEVISNSISCFYSDMRNSDNVTNWSISDTYSFSNASASMFRQYSPIFWALGVLGSHSSATEVFLTKCRLLEFLQNSLTTFSVMVSGGWFRCVQQLLHTSEHNLWVFSCLIVVPGMKQKPLHLTPCRNVNETLYLFILCF